MMEEPSCYVCQKPMGKESNSIKILELPMAVDCHKKCMGEMKALKCKNCGHLLDNRGRHLWVDKFGEWGQVRCQKCKCVFPEAEKV